MDTRRRRHKHHRHFQRDAAVIHGHERAEVFLSYAGANGSCSYRFTTNVTLHFSYQPKWLSGSNSVITNGVLSLTSYGGTNATQIEAAIGENQ